MTTRLALLAAMAALLTFPVQAADSAERTSKLIAVLQSDASFFEKARACQQLGEIGNRDAVPALAALLSDPHLSAYARSGLEGIPDGSAAAALREAARKMNGPQLAGVVNSLDVLRDIRAVALLSKLAVDPRSGVASEALLALGNISSPEAIRVLQQTLVGGPEATRAPAAAACVLAADRQRLAGNLSQALDVYDSVRNAKVPIAYRVGATRGAILARTTDRVPFLVEQLRSGEPAIRNAALVTIREIPDEKLAEALNAELPRASAELQGQILLALVDCHSPQSAAAVEVLAGSQNPELRKTALRVLGQLGPPAARALLTALQKEQTAEERALVLEGLRGMQGSTVDDLLLQVLASATRTRMRVDVIHLLESRGVAKASGELLKQASGQDREVSIAALSALKSLASPNELRALIALTKSCQDEAVRDAAESAVAGACSRSAGDTTGPDAVLNELKQATKPEERNSWIRILATVGYANALPFIETAASDPNEAVASNALTQLGLWPDPAPMETLLKAMDAGASLALRNRALVSVLDLATTATDEAQRSESVIVQWLQRANSVAQSNGDKRRILGLLGRLKTIESLRLLTSYLDNAELRTEAASGVVQLAPAVASQDAGTLRPALERIAATVANADLRDRAIRAAKAIPAQPAAVSLFDGRSLTGWEGATNVWRVRDGVIVGGSMDGNPRNEFLATARSYTNFVLHLEYKLVGTEGFVNSGVQFRSVRVSNPPNEMNGYQADIGAGTSGCLYDESRRNKYLARCSDETTKRLEKEGDWNSYEIRCEGARIQLRLNGEQTVDYTEPDSSIRQGGLIGLQIHGGNKAEVSFRNITIQER